jgi:hypothetical protein
MKTNGISKVGRVILNAPTVGDRDVCGGLGIIRPAGCGQPETAVVVQCEKFN